MRPARRSSRRQHQLGRQTGHPARSTPPARPAGPRDTAVSFIVGEGVPRRGNRRYARERGSRRPSGWFPAQRYIEEVSPVSASHR
ncbi:hypothetical protein L083_5368 [Actinoplanes sp. N902-109]|nr:hypothetical protein L083_5368 [Actinoplanes sp. N902-109]